jgi:uncharacterized protein YcnI
MKKIIVNLALVLSLIPSIVFAHSTVSPSTTATSKYETFTLSVPTEKEIPTVGIRIVVPAGVDRFTPFVKAGWTINTIKDANGNVTEVSWTGGSIPADQKDVFQFTARTAALDTTLVWKVYQSYQGGEIVAWDQQPGEGVETPYSVTEVKAGTSSTESDQGRKVDWPLILSIVALGVSFLAWFTKK